MLGARHVRLLGLDFGSTTSSALLAEARLGGHSVSGRVGFSEPRVLYRSPPVFTPFNGDGLDAPRLTALLDGWLRDCGLEDEPPFAGAALVTGLAARLLHGGERPAEQAKGWFIQPTVFADVPLHSALWREEIFGPVVCVNPFDTEAEALHLANDSQFGLAAAVMSADLERCERVARTLQAGIVWINCSQPTFSELPWGGVKRSGIGRELGEWGLDNYLETKQITRYESGDAWGWYLT